MLSTVNPPRRKLAKLRLFALLFLGLVNFQNAFAEDSSATTTLPGSSDTSAAPSVSATTAAPTTAPPRWGLSYLGIYAGPALTKPFGEGQINTNTAYYDGNAPQNLYNQIKLDYYLDNDGGFFIGPVANFEIVTSQGIQFLGQDSGFRIGHKKIIHTDSFNFSADLRFYGALKPSTAAQGEFFSPVFVHNMNWDIPHTKFSVGLLGIQTYYMFKGNSPIQDPLNPNDPVDLQLYFGPNVTYHVSDSFGVAVWAEFYPYHLLGDAWNRIEFYPTDIAPGITWDITPDVNLSPQILVYPGNLTWDGLGSIIYLSAKFM
jgi:hypothetical protein